MHFGCPQGFFEGIDLFGIDASHDNKSNCYAEV